MNSPPPPPLTVAGGIPQSDLLPHDGKVSLEAAQWHLDVPTHHRGSGGVGDGACQAVHELAS